ncbi:hypothetical protein AAHE18_18G224000 [Arachis hypogaea]
MTKETEEWRESIHKSRWRVSMKTEKQRSWVWKGLVVGFPINGGAMLGGQKRWSVRWVVLSEWVVLCYCWPAGCDCARVVLGCWALAVAGASWCSVREEVLGAVGGKIRRRWEEDFGGAARWWKERSLAGAGRCRERDYEN